MTRHYLTSAALAAALLLGTANVAGYAAGITIGGTDNGTAASVTDAANNGATSNLGGDNNGPLATVDNNGNAVGNGSQTNGTVNVLGRGGNGQLVEVDNEGNPIGDDSATGGSVNLNGLGSLLAGIDTGGLTGGGAGVGAGAGAGRINGDGLQRFAGGLSSGDRNTLNVRCRNVLADPMIYKDDVVRFCRMMAKI